MKKLLLSIFVLIGLNANAKKFIIQEFFHDPTNVSARRYTETDINNDKCALLIILTDLKDVSFKSNLGITRTIVKNDNEIWVYISPNEKRIELSAPDFMPESFNFSENIISLSVYYMKLTSDDQPLRKIEGKGGITINSNPEGALVMIDGMPELNKRTPFELPDVFALDYNLTLAKDRYFPIDTVVTVEAEKNSSYFFNLTPKFSDISVTSEPSGAMVTIDGAESGRTPLVLNGELLGLAHGDHIVTLEHKDCYKYNNTIIVKPGQDNIFHFELSQINGTISVRTIPDGANVYIDGDFLGITPIFNNKINMGSKVIDIHKEGFSSIRHKRPVLENEQILLTDTLSPAENMLINTKPEGAQFFLNEIYMGVTPLRIPIIKGMHEFTFKKMDYVEQHVQEDIQGKDLKKLEFEYKLDLDQYEVQVLSVPDSANIYIRGELKGVTPCKVYLPNEKTKIKFEKSKFISSQKKLKPGDSNFIIKGELRKRVKESKTVGFCFEKWNQPNDYKARFDIANLLIFKFGWKNFEDNVLKGSTPFYGIGSAEFNFSPTFPVTRYGEISPFGGIGAEVGLRDSVNTIDNMMQPVLSSYYYSYGSYFYVNIINNLQVYLQLAWINQLEDVYFDDKHIDYESAKGKEWNDFFDKRYGFRTAIGIRIRLGGT